MRVLFISSPTWDISNSYGNTFSNLFGGMEELEVYNIACNSGKNKNEIVKAALQLTDKAVLKSIFSLNYDPCVEMPLDGGDENEVVGKNLYKKLRNKRYTLFFLIREIIWKFGRWKKSSKLDSFLKEVNPDVLYINIYGDFFNYVSRVQYYIIKKLNVPVVGHINDDNYHYRKYGFSPLKYYLHYEVRKSLIKIVRECEYVECFAPQMKEEYEKIFHVPFYIIGKGLRKNEMPSNYYIPSNEKELLVLAYTGNLDDGRYEILYRLGLSLDKLSYIRKCKLVITSGTYPTDDMINKFLTCHCIDYRGSVSIEEIKKVQNNADYLIHVDNFDPYSISMYRLSFATKIIDCLRTGHPMIAIGPSCVNSIQELSNNDIAFVINKMEDIELKVQQLLEGKVDVNKIQNNVKSYLEEKRDLTTIQYGIKNRLLSLCNN